MLILLASATFQGVRIRANLGVAARLRSHALRPALPPGFAVTERGLRAQHAALAGVKTSDHATSSLLGHCGPATNAAKDAGTSRHRGALRCLCPHRPAEHATATSARPIGTYGSFWLQRIPGKSYDLAMEFKEAARIVSQIPAPHIPANRGQVLYEHIRKNRPKDLLELGSARGGSAVFIASALQANGTGQLISVDSSRWRWRDPTPQEVLDKAGLSHRVTLDKRFSTYTWFLKTELEKCMDDTGTVHPEYDFIFIDGAKNWSTDGLAVVLAERLLRPGGWLLLDDLGWSYEKHANKTQHYEIDIAKLSEEERVQPHLRAIFDLLIKPNPAFDQFVIQDDWWGWARKVPEVPMIARARAAVGRPGTAVSRTRTRFRYIPRGVRKRLRRLQRTQARLLDP